MNRMKFLRAVRKSFRRETGYLNPLPEDADKTLDAVEARLGFALPPILRLAYTHIGNDVFAPEWSAEKYLKFHEEETWPERMVPLYEEGCGIWCCLDCSLKQAPVIKWRGDLSTDGEDPSDSVFEHVSPSFVEWLRRLLPRQEWEG